MKLTYQIDTNSFDLTLPDTVSDVTYSQFLDWRKPIENLVQAEVRKQEAERKKDQPKKLTEHNYKEFADKDGDVQPEETTDEPTFILNTFRYFCLLVEMDAHLYRADILESLHKSLGAIIPENISAIPIHHKGDNATRMLTQGVDWFDKKGVSLTRLLCHLACMFRNYIAAVPMPDVTYSFDYAPPVYHHDKDGKRYFAGYAPTETYYIEPDRVKRVFDRPDIATINQKQYSTDEVFELTETKRIFELQIEKKGDPDGALEFQMDLVLLAILLRKEGETLPINRQERKLWIDQRSQHFKSMPMDVIYKVQAFFLPILTNLLVTRITQAISAKRLSFQPSTQEGTEAASETPKGTKKKSDNSSIEPSEGGGKSFSPVNKGGLEVNIELS